MIFFINWLLGGLRNIGGEDFREADQGPEEKDKERSEREASLAQACSHSACAYSDPFCSLPLTVSVYGQHRDAQPQLTYRKLGDEAQYSGTRPVQNGNILTEETML